MRKHHLIYVAICFILAGYSIIATANLNDTTKEAQASIPYQATASN